MTYFALTFLVRERQRQICADYLRARDAESLRVQLGRAFVTIGTRLLATR